MTALLELRGLTVELPMPGRWVRPVNEVSLRLERGGSLGLVGESGSGKTMLSLALMGLLPQGARVTGTALLNADDRGAREVNLAALREDDWTGIRGRRIAMVFQEPMTALNPVMRAGAQIGEAIRAHNRGLAREEIHRRVIAALVRTAVPEPELRARQYPHELSGGLRQRVMIAMALAAGDESKSNGDGGGRLLIADEPTTALDVTVQKQILALLVQLRRELGLSLIFITHDLAVVAQVAERVAVMYAGRVVEDGPTGEVLRAPRHPYTEGLLRASPQLSRRELIPIPGMVPALDALPHGCAFEPRCALRRDECVQAVPEARAAGPGHEARCILI
jgi:oligopeptide/dipeptide ABC transporter ATP-binding protein